MPGSRFPLTAMGIARLKLTLAERWVYGLQHDRLALGQNISAHDSKALELGRLIREFKEKYYARKS